MAVTGRPREFDRDTALKAAMLVFWRKGFAATSMNDLCAAMQIRAPSLYAAFGSKEGLFLEAVEHYSKTLGPTIWGRLAEGPTARASVEKLLRAAVKGLPACGVMPAGAGRSGMESAAKQAGLKRILTSRAFFRISADKPSHTFGMMNASDCRCSARNCS